MTYLKKPAARHPGLPTNAIGLTRRDYEGPVSTLCAGCGHDAISATIIEACFELSIHAHQVAKLSGIGCSSKTPGYFLNQSHGFNAVHGRMPSIATGANLANRELLYLGVSGDGDTASIGIGQFIHAARRNLNMTYIVENNGTYGLTKGQFSATNDRASLSRKGEETPFEAIDLARLAIELGAGYVARSFSGDREQLVPLLKSAMSYRGFALLDVISPCVTFNNHPTSTKSFDYVREHNEAVAQADLVPTAGTISADYAPGQEHCITLHDGSRINLYKLDNGYDPTNAGAALRSIREYSEQGLVVTGLLYVNEVERDLHALLNTCEEPLNTLDYESLCPGAKALETINDDFR